MNPKRAKTNARKAPSNNIQVVEPTGTPLITVTPMEVFDSRDAFGGLFAQPLQPIVASQLAAIGRAVDVKMDTYENQRVLICESFGAVQESPDSPKYKFPTPDAEENAEIAVLELIKQPFTIGRKMLTIFELRSTPISAQSLSQLSWLIHQPEEAIRNGA